MLYSHYCKKNFSISVEEVKEHLIASSLFIKQVKAALTHLAYNNYASD
jgi:hypothetical protein